MIDIHNHVIYSVDDGSKNLEQSIKMIKTARDVGFDEICFTPHYMEDGYKTDRNTLEQKVEVIKEEIQKENIDVKIHLGEEVFIFPELVENLDKLVCLNDSRYILIEFPLIEEINYVDDVIYKLCSSGKVPIIAHPERYLATDKDFNFAKNIIERGGLIQVNLNSVVGHYGNNAKELAIKLLKHNMVHFLGSDAHSSAGYLKTLDSIKIITRLIGSDKLNELLEINPKKVLNNDEIDLEAYTEVEKKKSIFSIFQKKVV